jgi:hypothetical protein
MSKIKSGRTRLASLLAGTAMSAVSLLGASLARASTTITRQNGTRTTRWTEIVTTSGETIGVSEASLTNAAGTLDRGDAFDGALEVYIYPASDTASSIYDTPYVDTATVVNNSPNGGTVSGTASTSVAGQDIGVDWSLVFASDAARVNGTFIVTNNSSAPFTGFVGIFTDFGSDDSTVIEATSSGDTTVATGDTWVVTSEGSGESSGDDPVILSASTSAGVEIGPDTDLDGYDELIWRTPVSLAAGESVTVNASHCLFETIAAATTAAAAGNCDEASVTAPPAGDIASVPTLTNPALLALAVLTGLLGAGNLVPRRKGKNS